MQLPTEFFRCKFAFVDQIVNKSLPYCGPQLNKQHSIKVSRLRFSNVMELLSQTQTKQPLPNHHPRREYPWKHLESVHVCLVRIEFITLWVGCYVFVFVLTVS